jgi:hypothetical protein
MIQALYRWILTGSFKAPAPKRSQLPGAPELNTYIHNGVLPPIDSHAKTADI